MSSSPLTPQLQRRSGSISEHLDPSLPSILRRIYANRGVTTMQELDLSARGLVHFQQLKDCERAAEIVAAAIEQQRKICICGDFDADGATSVALLMSALRAMGATQLMYLVPNRFADGYGLSPGLVDYAQQQGAELLITVDNGISSFAGVERANQLGLQVIITDHHLQGAQLPAAAAIVNPNRLDCAFPSKSLAGVGVAFYLLLAVRAWFRQHRPEHPAANINIADFLDLVAVGSVADVVPLDYNNRILVQQGLGRIREGRCRPGILALLEVAGRDYRQISAADLGFAVGPRINAAGRLDDIQMGIECLLAPDLQQARMIALRLDELNRQRRQIEVDMQADAERCLAQLRLQDQLPPILTVQDESFHQGVIGILAGRLKEQYYRPVMVFAPTDGDELKGSCRSVTGVHIRDLLAQVASEAPGVISRFGGHAMAAGLSVPRAAWTEFNAVLQRVAADWIDASDLSRVIWSDGELDSHELSLQSAQALHRAGPFGQDFPAPVFDGQFRVVDRRWLKDVHLKLQIQPIAGGPTLDAIAFNVPRAAWEWREQREIHLVYRLDVNEFRGNQSVQLMVEHIF
ncbi:MAG: single-stranded-DNA-specific exonuclease RecJ [Aliidiomarina sp.]|uniref:single-stranded-DNA-specific exonuclease RecJ n=1 Tax=Aliidiomarina sp. TaxID=1872439 RepID=UPI0025C3D7A9|nr:single-stranded-DNA-specific exonuclease RecJ [Aliidiomarina sp.]MCH8500452.1 single-stranded-DNA-specific exonuclease RecJ [Aliidiomarina sp.]